MFVDARGTARVWLAASEMPKNIFYLFFGVGFPLIVSLKRRILHLLSGLLSTPDHPCVLYLTPDGGKVSSRWRKEQQKWEQGVGWGSIWQHMSKTGSLRTASWSWTGILIRLFPPICTAVVAALCVEDWHLKSEEGLQRCVVSYLRRWTVFLKDSSRHRIIHRTQSAVICCISLAQLLSVIITDLSIFHRTTFNRTGGSNKGLKASPHFKLASSPLTSALGWLTGLASAPCRKKLHELTTETSLRGQQVYSCGVTRKKFCNSRGMQKKGPEACFTASVWGNHDIDHESLLLVCC